MQQPNQNNSPQSYVYVPMYYAPNQPQFVVPQQVHPHPYGYSYPPVYYPPTQVMPVPPVYTPSAPPQQTVVTTKKSEKTVSTSNSISFNLNGKQVSVTNPDPLMSLNEYIRTEAGLTGTKKTCGEGGCGACTVMLTKYDQTLNKQINVPVNSCLRLLCSVDGENITTVEGIGSQKTGFNPVQQRIAEGNGSQCGFCTPGMVMSMYSLLQENPSPTHQDVEDRFDGNLCRCTGYRQLLDSFQTFVEDPSTCNKKTSCKMAGIKDIEDLGMLKINKSFMSQVNGVTWYTPQTLNEVYQLMNENNGSSIKLVVGNTSSGVFKTDVFSVYIDISGISDLLNVSLNNGATFGSAVTIQNMLFYLDQWSNSTQYPKYQTANYAVMSSHIKKIANTPVRSVASWAGNVMMAHNHNWFPSDMYLVLLGAGATLTIGSSQGIQSGIDLIAFQSFDMTNKVILSVTIPFGRQNEIFKTFKVALRHENSHAIVNAAFRVLLDANYNVIEQPTFAYGNVVDHHIRATKTELALYGKNITSPSTFQTVLSILEQEVVPDPEPGRTAYRQSLVSTLFYKFYVMAQPTVPSSLQSIVNPFVRPISSGSQSFETSPAEFPVGEPIPKLSATLQASGEAKYTDDMDPLKGTLYAAYVTATTASATIANVDASAALEMTGVVAFFSAKDIPKSQNTWGPTIPDEEVFTSSQITYYGQTIGLIVADTQRHADDAAKAVNVTYTNVQTPILTIEDAIAKNSFYPNYPQAPTGGPIVSGNVTTGFAQSTYVIDGSVSCGSQAHFHMETHTAYCIPQENGNMKVVGSLQWAQLVQNAVAQVLGKKASNVTVECKRVGGGYGAKITRNVLPICAVAFAADQLGVPIKMHMDLTTNLNMIGKRHPFTTQYKVGVDSNGKLQALQMMMYADQGGKYDGGNGSLGAAFMAFDNTYYCPNVYVDGKVVMTNTAPNTSTRGPGWLQAIFTMEHIMEHISSILNIPVDTVKQRNFYQKGQVTPYGEKLPYFNIPTIWNQLVSNADYQNRVSFIQQFNTANRWTKRGISIVPIKFGVYWAGGQMGALVNIYGDGTVTISQSGIEMGQGLYTKVAQAAAMELGIPMGLIRVEGVSSLTVPNAEATGGSVGSELSVKATLLACQTLNDRLKPIRALLKNPSWEQLVSAALGAGVDLQAKGWFNPPNGPNGPQQYNTYAAACTEVEIDVLTGEIQVLRNDIVFDCGISMNPAVDMGQIIGGFVMGMGYHTVEQVIYDTNSISGDLITNGTWEYKIPSHKDIPIQFNISLLKNSYNNVGILGSKAVGEPPLCISCAVLFAARHAIAAARNDAKLSGYFEFNSPGTVDNIQQTCSVSPSQFYLN